MICPIIRKDITEEECLHVSSESHRDVKDKQAKISNRYKRIIGWKAICKQCKEHKKP
jgi:hypothetical protein